MPTLSIHTHCQVAQNSLRTDQNLSKSMAAQTHGKTEEIKHENTTHNIANKGFSGMRRFVARFNFSCNLIGNHPQSLTGHTAKLLGMILKYCESISNYFTKELDLKKVMKTVFFLGMLAHDRRKLFLCECNHKPVF